MFRFRLVILVTTLLLTFFAIPAQSVSAGECMGVTGNCTCDASGISCSGPKIVEYKCNGRFSHCEQNEQPSSGEWPGGTISRSTSECGVTLQLDIFNRTCRLPDGGWDSSCQFQGAAVWYSGDCPPPEETPTPTPTPPSPVCKDTYPIIRVSGLGERGNWKTFRQFKREMEPKIGDAVDFTCAYLTALGNHNSVYNLVDASGVLPMRIKPPGETAIFPSKPPVNGYVFEKAGTYRVTCRYPNTDVLCPGYREISVAELPISECGGACGVVNNVNQGACADDSVCINNQCVLSSCHANPESCLPNGCEPIPATQCGGECGPSLASCPDGNTCDDGTCVMNECLASNPSCAPDGCSLIPDVECGESCGAETGLCPLDNTCQSGTCVLDTCAQNPEICETDMCSVSPLQIQCIDLEASSTDFSLNGSYDFTCTEVDDAQRYEFRALYTTSKDTLTGAEVTPIATKQGNASESFTIEKVGKYVFQCRPCLSDTLCTEWGSADSISQERALN